MLTNHFTLEVLSEEHRKDVIDIFNYYIQNSTAAYRDKIVEYSFYDNFLEYLPVYPGYVIKDIENTLVGFGILEPLMSIPTFSTVSEVTYFIHNKYVGKGFGSALLAQLENDAKLKGINKLIANISSENHDSINFHKKHGFIEYGKLENCGNKLGRVFSIIYMSKDINSNIL